MVGLMTLAATEGLLSWCADDVGELAFSMRLLNKNRVALATSRCRLKRIIFRRGLHPVPKTPS
jgi:hypothetical protein